MNRLTLALLFALSGVLPAAAQLPPEFDTPDKKLLFAAVHNDADLAREALDAGANLELEVSTGQRLPYTPLQTSVMLGNPDTVSLFLKQGASLEWREPLSSNAIYLAVEYGQAEVMKLLIPYADRLGPTRASLYEGAFDLALKQGHLEILKLLVQAGIDPKTGRYKHARNPNREPDDHRNRSILSMAAKHGDPEIVRYLIDEGGLDLNHNYGYHENAAYYGYPGNYPLWIAVSMGNLEAARVLIERGADVNVTAYGDPTKMSCLAVALRCGHLDCADLLLEKGANPAAETSDPVSLSKITADWAGFKKYTDRIAKMGVKLELWDILEEEFKSRPPSAEITTAAPVSAVAARLLEGDWGDSPLDAESQHDGPLRVAILGDEGSSEFSDLLLVTMSGVDNVECIERSELDGVIREHELDRAGILAHRQLRDFSKLIAADHILLVSTISFERTKVYRIQCLDVKYGLLLDVRYASTEAAQWGEFNTRYAAYFSRSILSPSKAKRLPVSLMGVHANWATAEGKRLEKELFYVLEHALSKQPGILLLDRQSLEKLASEKRIGDSEAHSFSRSGLFINARVDVDLTSGKVQRIVLEATKPEEAAGATKRLEEPASGHNLSDLCGKIARRFANHLNQNNEVEASATLDPNELAADRDALVAKADWLFRMGMHAEAQAAIENAIALGIESSKAWYLNLVILEQTMRPLLAEVRGNEANNRRIFQLEHDRLRAIESYLMAFKHEIRDSSYKSHNPNSLYDTFSQLPISFFRMRPVSFQRRYHKEISELENHFVRLFDDVIKPFSEQDNIRQHEREILLIYVFDVLPALNTLPQGEYERIVKETIHSAYRNGSPTPLYPRSVVGGIAQWNAWVRQYGSPRFVVDYYRNAGEYLFSSPDGQSGPSFVPSAYNADKYRAELVRYLEETGSMTPEWSRLKHSPNTKYAYLDEFILNNSDVVAMSLEGQKETAAIYQFNSKIHPESDFYSQNREKLAIYSSVPLLREILKSEQDLVGALKRDTSTDPRIIPRRESSRDSITARMEELERAAEGHAQKAADATVLKASVWDLTSLDQKNYKEIGLIPNERKSTISYRERAFWAIGKHLDDHSKFSIFRLDEKTRQTTVQTVRIPKPKGVASNISPDDSFYISDKKILIICSRPTRTIVVDRESLSATEINDFIPIGIGDYPHAFFHDGDLYYTAIPSYLMADAPSFKGKAVSSSLVFLKLDLETMKHTVISNFRRKPAETPLDHPFEGKGYAFHYNETEQAFLFNHNHNKFEYDPSTGEFTKLSDQEFGPRVRGMQRAMYGSITEPDKTGMWLLPRTPKFEIQSNKVVRIAFYNQSKKKTKLVDLKISLESGDDREILKRIPDLWGTYRVNYYLYSISEKYYAFIFRRTFFIVEHDDLYEAIMKATPMSD